MFPAVTYENSVHVFNFYHDGAVQQGMSHRTKLYRLAKAFDVKYRSQAYSVGCHLSHQGSETVITVSPQHYKVWVDIRFSSTLEKMDFSEIENLAPPNHRLVAAMPAC